MTINDLIWTVVKIAVMVGAMLLISGTPLPTQSHTGGSGS